MAGDKARPEWNGQDGDAPNLPERGRAAPTLGHPRAGQGALVAHGRERAGVQVVPGRTTRAMVRTAAPAEVVTVLATARGPLGPVALRQAIVILRSLFAFLVSQKYLIGNAFAGVALPRETGRVLGSRRTLTFNQWDAIEERLEAVAIDDVGRRRARAVRWLYATGLRLSDMANAQCGDLREVDYRLPNGKQDTGWLLTVVGKGSKLREVPVPVSLVEELRDELGRHGLRGDVAAETNQDVPVLVRFDDGKAQPWSMPGLAKGIKALLAEIAAELDPDDAKQLRKASTHWLRHTHGSHALNGRPGQSGVPIQVVQNNLGHASVGTTSGYLTTERDMRLAAMKGSGAKR